MVKPIIWVEGNIGSGKTTLTKILAEKLRLTPLYEPVDDNPYLKMFYEEEERIRQGGEAPNKYAFAMQIFLMGRRYALQKHAAYGIHTPEVDGYVIDRGLPGDRVFARQLWQDRSISALDWDTYNMWYDIMHTSIVPPTLLVFLEVSPSECFARARGYDNSRKRDQESVVTDKIFLDYLMKLSLQYRLLLEDIERGEHMWSRGMQVMRIQFPSMDDRALAPIVGRITNALNNI